MIKHAYKFVYNIIHNVQHIKNVGNRNTHYT